MVHIAGGALLVAYGHLWPWSPAAYGVPYAFNPEQEVATLTPASIIGVLKLGYAPLLHETAHISR